MALRITVDGDPDGGWLVEIHDGDAIKVYRPEGDTPLAALSAALAEFAPPPASDPVPVADPPAADPVVESPVPVADPV